FDSTHRRQDEDQKEKEKQGDWRKIRNPPGQRPLLQLLRHPQRNVEAGHQVLIIPLQFPSLSRLSLCRRRQRILGKIEAAKIGLGGEVKVLSPPHFVATAQFITPVVLPLRMVSRFHQPHRTCWHGRARGYVASPKLQRHRLPVQCNLYAVIDRLLGW